MFKDKVLMITGGTGSFGNAVLKKFLKLLIKTKRLKLSLPKSTIVRIDIYMSILLH